MLFNKLKENIIERLNLLNKELTYHNASHTLSDVMLSAIYLAEKSNINVKDFLLLKTAVLFHDLGYLKKYDSNEFIGAEMAKEILPSYEYTSRQIEVIVKLILSTKLPQTPTSLLEKIICDADLDSLHRDDFLDLGENLRKELCHHKSFINKKQWLKAQLEFVKGHSYHTEVDISLRNNGKLKNIKLLEESILGS